MQLAVFLVVTSSTSLVFGSVLSQDRLGLDRRNSLDPETHIFHIPTGLRDGYEINVTGQLATVKERITFSLMTEDKNKNAPDWNNVACEVQFKFLSNFTEDSITIVTILNGSATPIDEGLPASITLNDTFYIGFAVKHQKNIEVKFGESVSDSGINLQHNLEEISYLTIVGSIGKVAELNFKLGDGGDDGAAYNSIQLNGESQRAPPWPNPQKENETMFILPRQLNSGDKISVSGRLRSDRQRFAVNLVTGYSSPDYNNIACQLEVQFNQENRVTLKIIQNGYTEEISGDYQDISASDWFPSNSFYFTFNASIFNNYDGQLHSLIISIGESHLEQIKLKHRIEDIRFLTLDGDIEKVDKLDFEFS